MLYPAQEDKIYALLYRFFSTLRTESTGYLTSSTARCCYYYRHSSTLVRVYVCRVSASVEGVLLQQEGHSPRGQGSGAHGLLHALGRKRRWRLPPRGSRGGGGLRTWRWLSLAPSLSLSHTLLRRSRPSLSFLPRALSRSRGRRGGEEGGRRCSRGAGGDSSLLALPQEGVGEYTRARKSGRCSTLWRPHSQATMRARARTLESACVSHTGGPPAGA